MVGMEELQVHSKVCLSIQAPVVQVLLTHSKSYLVRWMNVSAGNTISWSIQPHKKSLNFGIFKHPGGKEGLPATPILPPACTSNPNTAPNTPIVEGPPLLGLKDKIAKTKDAAGLRNDGSSVVQKLESIGMKCVAWSGKCEADKVSTGKYDVVEGESGMYGLVFDNTFSKQVSKTATLVLLTYPTNAPPKSGHHLHFSQASSADNTVGGTVGSPTLGSTIASGSSESLPQDIAPLSKTMPSDPRPKSQRGRPIEVKSFGGSTFYTGVLLKRRRKHNNYARRFFSLDFTSSTLSYYRNRQSSALRGAIPISLAAIAIGSDRSREISVDSGAEIWLLKAPNQRILQDGEML